MKEIEVLVEVLCPYEEALTKLSSLGEGVEKHTIDMYFYDPLRDDLQPGKNHRLNASFRIRQKDGKSLIAFKQDHFEKSVWQYSDEHETEVGSYEICCNIVKHLGLKNLVTINNTKRVYLNDKYEIVLEKVDDLGVFLEVEYLDGATKRTATEVKKDIYTFLKKLEIPCSAELNSGKPELMLRKLGKA